MEKQAAQLFIECLEREGVRHIFAVPGEENLDILEALRTSRIELVLTRHEQGAGFMAATYGRLTGKAGVCMATLGPGATNLVTPAAYAQLAAFPLIVLTGQKPIKKSKQGRFQIVDVVEMMRPLTKHAVQVIHGNTIPTIVREAFRLAQEERPGAVHIELPEDIAREKTHTKPIPSARTYYPQVHMKAINQAAAMIDAAKFPLVLLGAGANRNRISKASSDFIDHTGIPFFNTQMGKGVIDERHELFIGTTALSSDDYVHCIIDRADLIINVGHDVIEKPPFFMQQGGKLVIHINFFSAVIDEIYFPQVELVGDIASTLNALKERLAPKSARHKEYIDRVRSEFANHFHEQCRSNDDAKKPTPQKVVAILREVMPDNGVIALDNGVYKLWFARNYPTYETNTLLLDNALATMGAGLPSALAVKMFKPERKVIAVCGDGGFMMNSQELETAVRLNLDVVVIVLRDDAYGMIKWKQAGMGLPGYGLDYGNPDFIAYAKAYGAQGWSVRTAGTLKETIAACLNIKGVHLVEVLIDYSENEKHLIDDLKSKTCLI
ncbi:acetolactate synthase [Spirochaetota bacterium]|nr:acetolactate synthase [Spirochaetota bacterium]